VPVLIPKPNAQENDLERALGAFEKIYTLEKRIVRKTDESSTQLLKKSLRLLLLRAGGTLNTGIKNLTTGGKFEGSSPSKRNQN
jgi:hypothetical protein